GACGPGQLMSMSCFNALADDDDDDTDNRMSRNCCMLPGTPPAVSPTPTATASPTPTPTASLTPTRTASPTPSPTATATRTATATATPFCGIDPPSLTELISQSSAGCRGNDHSQRSSISANGRFVAFESVATNLVPGDTNGDEDAFVRDRQTGTTERVSVDSSGGQGNLGGGAPSISADGRFVSFTSASTNLVP